MAKTVVILGGSYAGVHVAHHVLKNTADTKVVLVSKNSHFYWNMASVRAIIPDTFADSQLFAPLTDCFAHYAKDRVEVVVGTADHVDTAAKTVAVVVAAGAGDGDGARTFAYDQLVLATGARSNVPGAGIAVPWKAEGTYDDLVALLAATRRKVAAAQHIVVAGGGLTGVEVAADLGAAFAGKPADQGGKTVVLLSAGAALLGGDRIAAAAASALRGFGVDVRTGQTVTGVRARPDGKTELTIDDGTTTRVTATDLYLPAVGQTPNSAYLDAQLLTADGYVRIDGFFRAAAVSSNDVWALGDVVSVPRASFLYTQKQASGVGKNVVLALQNKPPADVKLMPFDIVTVSLGPAAGAGRMGWMRLPGFMVASLKSQRLGTQMLPSYKDGSVA